MTARRSSCPTPPPPTPTCRYDEEGDVELAAYPADTLTQTRAFYPDAEAVARVRALAADDWEVHPNLHFGFRALGLAWAHGPIEGDEYLTL